MLEDDPSAVVELTAIEQLVSKLGQVHEVRVLVDVTRNEDWPVDALVRVGNLNADYKVNTLVL